MDNKKRSKSDSKKGRNLPKWLPTHSQAIKIALYYALLGALWIFFSDKLLFALVQDAPAAARLSSYKGWFYVGITALFLWAALDRYFARIRQSAQETQESESRFTTIFENSPVAMGISRVSDQKIIHVNTALTKLYGYSPKEFIGHTTEELQLWADPADRQKFITQLQKHESTRDLEFTARLKSGEKRKMLVSGELMDLNGEPCLIAQIMDITERKQMEDEIRAAQELAQHTIDSLDAHVCVLDENGVVVSVNQAWRNFADANPPTPEDYYIGRNYLTVCDNATDEDARQARDVAKAIRAAIQGKLDRFQLEYPCHSPDAKRWFVLRLTSFTHNDSIRIVLTHENITERKQSELEVREKEKRFTTIFHTNPLPIMISRLKDGKYTEVNSSFEEITGYSSEEIIGRTAKELNIWVNFEDRNRMVQELNQQRSVHGFEFQLQNRNGDVHEMLMSAEAIELEGEVYGLAIAQDITERKLVERASQTITDIQKQMISTNNLKDLYQLTGENIQKLIGDAYVVVSMINEDAQAMRVAGLFGFGDIVEKWLPKFKINLTKSSYPLDEMTPEELRLFRSGKLEKFEDGIYRLMLGRIPKSLCTTFEKEFRLTGIYTMGFIRQEKHLGGVIILARRDLTPFKGMIETIINYAAIIIDRIMAEEILRESEAKYRTLTEQIPAIVYIEDVTREPGSVQYISPQAERMLGFPVDQWLHPNMNLWYEQIHPNERTWVTEAYERCYSFGEAFDCEYRMVASDGRIVWIHDQARTINDEHGNPHLIHGVMYDITERKEAEKSLRESEEKYRLLSQELEERVQERTAEITDLYENAPAGYHSLDADGNFLMVNQTELNWLGYTRDELIGKNITTILSPASASIFKENFPKLKETGQINNREIEITRKDGSSFPAMMSGSVIYDAQGGYISSRSTLVDITERKQAEEALRLTNFKLERALRIKDEFLATMSHELRTPLTGILGLSEAVQEGIYGDLNDKQAKAIKNVENSGRHLLELINDVLDVSKIEAGMLELHPTPCALNDICESSIQLAKGMAEKKNLRVNFIKGQSSVLLNGDPRRLKQIFVNLLSNAVKFTPDNGEVNLEIVSDEDDQDVKIIVRDTGIGIDAVDLPKLFKPFVQLDASLSREQSGTGLGLALVKSLVDMHGGSIQIESEKGRGSSFTVTLPVYHFPAKKYETEIKPAVKTGQTSNASPIVMIVDDNETNINMLKDYLTSRNFKTAAAMTGEEFLKRVEDVRPDIVLMDIQMPEMDGLETTRRLRKHSDPRIASVPVIAITALAMPGDREKCLEAGANLYLSKPVRLRELPEILYAQINEQNT